MAINDPRDIPGLLVWYSAEAETGYADGAAMTGWTDLSGNGNHATLNTATGPLWQATTGSGGGPAVRFDGSRAFNLPNMFAGVTTSAEVLTVVKSDGADCSLWAFGETISGNDEQHFPYTGTIYETFALGTDNRRSFNPSMAITSWRRYNIWAAYADWTARLDGVDQFSYYAPTGPKWTPDPRLGRGRKLSGDDMYFKGHVAALVLYNRKLTTAERADLDAWATAHPSGGTAPASTPAITLTGTAPAVTGSLSATVTNPTPAVTLTGTAPAVTGAFDVAVAVPPISGDLTGTAPKVTGSFALELADAVTGNLAGTAPAVSGSFGITASGPAVEVATDSVNRLNGLTLETQWHVEITGPVSTPTRQPAHDYAVATSLPEPTLVEGRPT